LFSIDDGPDATAVTVDVAVYVVISCSCKYVVQSFLLSIDDDPDDDDDCQRFESRFCSSKSLSFGAKTFGPATLFLTRFTNLLTTRLVLIIALKR
jgi:hypothetical protein